MHKEAMDFVLRKKERFPEFFNDNRVLEVGAANINGSVRSLFTNCQYIGNDVAPYRGVDVVCRTKDLLYPTGHFDTIISTECFEHDSSLKESLLNILRMLRHGGLFIFTCATVGRAPHGTKEHRPEDSVDNTYYQNVVWEEIAPILLPFFTWSEHEIRDTDLYFWGLRK